MEQFKPYATTDIENFIEKGIKLSISESSISYKSVITHSNGSVAIKYHNVITKYRDIIRPYIVSETLSDIDHQTYKFQPHLLCYDLYGTPELAYSLLYINNMVSFSQFTKKTIKVFTSNFPDILEELMTLNKEDLIKNRMDNELEY